MNQRESKKEALRALQVRVLDEVQGNSPRGGRVSKMKVGKIMVEVGMEVIKTVEQIRIIDQTWEHAPEH